MYWHFFLNNLKNNLYHFCCIKLSGSSPLGKKRNDICFSGLSSLMEFSAALTAALYPLSSESKQITISLKIDLK